MTKVFISYKYSDNQVDQTLDQQYWAIEKDPYTGEERRLDEATGRAYANLLEEIIGKENTIKGERQTESLEDKSESQIWEILKPKVYDSTVTLVVISPGMKDNGESEDLQWIPREIRYSLTEHDRGGKTSHTNALLGVIIPNRDGRCGYIYGRSNCPDCADVNLIDKLNNPHLFKILRGNIFNRKNDGGRNCTGKGLTCDTTRYDDGHSYLHLVTLDQFREKPQEHINFALSIKDNGAAYEIEKDILCNIRL